MDSKLSSVYVHQGNRAHKYRGGYWPQGMELGAHSGSASSTYVLMHDIEPPIQTFEVFSRSDP